MPIIDFEDVKGVYYCNDKIVEGFKTLESILEKSGKKTH
jgi:hypothetical protein